MNLSAVRRPPIPGERSCPLIPDLGEFDREVICCLDSATGRTRHAARHSLHHLERAWAIKSIDPEMAAFRAITAEEEAAAALFLCLRQLRYTHSGRLKFRRHDFKAALYPFMAAVWHFFTEVGTALPFVPELAATTVGERRVLELRLRFQEGKIATPLPPLNFAVRKGETLQPYYFERQLGEIARNAGKRDAVEHIKEVANLRNILLYAGDQGWATIATDVDEVIRKYQKRVMILLRVLCLIFPHEEKALFVTQCIDAFLLMMRGIRDEDAVPEGDVVGGAS